MDNHWINQTDRPSRLWHYLAMLLMAQKINKYLGLDSFPVPHSTAEKARLTRAEIMSDQDYSNDRMIDQVNEIAECSWQLDRCIEDIQEELRGL